MSTTVEYILDIKTRKATKALSDASRQTNKVNKSLNTTKASSLQAAGALGAAFAGITAGAGIAAGALSALANTAISAAQAMYDLTVSVVDNINDLNDLSTVSGISAKNIEALKTAFVASGQSADSANVLFKQFPRIMNQLTNESSDAAKIMQGLGLSLKDAGGNAKSADAVFIEMINAVQGIEDSTQKARIATALFGRQSSNLVQALGAGKMNEFTAAVERYGSKAAPEASQSAAQFQKTLALLELVSDRTKQSFVENTGTLNFFGEKIKVVAAILQGFNVFLTKGTDGIQRMGKAGLLLANLVMNQLFASFKHLILGGMKPFIDTLDLIFKTLTGKSVFTSFAEVLGNLTITHFDLNDAVKAGKEAYEKELQVLNESTAATDEASKTSKELEEQYKKISGVLDRLNKGTKTNTQETEKNTKAKKDQDAAEKGRIKQLEKQAKLLSILAEENKKRFQAIKDMRDIIKDAGSDQITELQKINQLEQERIDKLTLIGKQEGINTDIAKKAVQERAQRERQALQERKAVGAIGIGETIIRSATDPRTMISAVAGAFGPIGGAIGGVVQALSDLGQKDPEQLKQEFKATFEGIAQGIKVLIPLLIEVLPPLLFDAALSIVDAILKLPQQLMIIIGKGLTAAFKAIGGIFADPLAFFTSIGDAIANSIKAIFDFFTTPFTEGFGGSMMGGGRMLSGQGGLRFTGGDGFAMLHQGEMVVPRSGQISSRVAQDVQNATGASGSVNITINSIVTERSAIDALVDKIEERYGSFGQSTSPLFGGR